MTWRDIGTKQFLMQNEKQNIFKDQIFCIVLTFLIMCETAYENFSSNMPNRTCLISAHSLPAGQGLNVACITSSFGYL